MENDMNRMQLKVMQIQQILEEPNVEFCYMELCSAEEMALACEEYPEVMNWWTEKIEGGNRWRWGYLEEKWGQIRANLDCRAAVNAVESAIT